MDIKTRIIKSIITKINQRTEDVVVEEYYCALGVIDRKVIRYNSEPIEDNHTSSSVSYYSTPQRKRRRAEQSALRLAKKEGVIQ